MKKLIIASSILIATSIHAGPMGFDMGQTNTELLLRSSGNLEPVSEYLAYSTTVSKSSPEFSRYGFFTTPLDGLCKVMASTKPFTSPGEAAELKLQHARLSEIMTKGYGQPTKVENSVSEEVKSQGPNAWTKGVLDGKAVLNTEWVAQSSGVKFPHQVRAVYLKAHATSANEGYLVLQFVFNNYDACITTLKTNK
jgi:hypothetical protein